MKYAIVESGGKQYKAVEGETIEVDRLPVEAGKAVELERILLMVDGEEISVGTPTVAGLKVKATLVEHSKGPKVVIFKYRPKKHYRVKGGHRQQYSLLHIEQVGKPSPKPAKVEEPAKVEAPVIEAKPAKAAKKEVVTKAAPAAKKAAPAPKKTATAPKKAATSAKKPAVKKTAVKSK